MAIAADYRNFPLEQQKKITRRAGSRFAIHTKIMFGEFHEQEMLWIVYSSFERKNTFI
jgi:hypothetical protein